MQELEDKLLDGALSEDEFVGKYRQLEETLRLLELSDGSR